MPLFDLLPAGSFLALALLGILAGFGLRVWLREAAWRRAGRKLARQERFEFLAGTLSQSAAVGLALTLLADVLLVSWTNDVRVLAGLTV
jgi:predicted lysophospholipase L1 biosynthesis ABC-type transport system permease subunit